MKWTGSKSSFVFVVAPHDITIHRYPHYVSHKWSSYDAGLLKKLNNASKLSLSLQTILTQSYLCLSYSFDYLEFYLKKINLKICIIRCKNKFAFLNISFSRYFTAIIMCICRMQCCHSACAYSGSITVASIFHFLSKALEFLSSGFIKMCNGFLWLVITLSCVSLFVLYPLSNLWSSFYVFFPIFW
jgi:hypothetical protein